MKRITGKNEKEVTLLMFWCSTLAYSYLMRNFNSPNHGSNLQHKTHKHHQINFAVQMNACTG